ncbi:hypothetical protein MMPV_005634 [Pyropia vietnamensis]
MGRASAALVTTVVAALAIAATTASPTSRSSGGGGGGGGDGRKTLRLTAFKYVPCGYGYQPGFAMGYHDHIMTGGGGVAGGGTGGAASANTNTNANNNNVNNNNNHITIQLPPASRRAASDGASAADRYRAGYAAGRAFGVHYDGRLAGAVADDDGEEDNNGAADADEANDSAGGSGGDNHDDGASVRFPTSARVAGVVERRGWCWIKVAWTQPVSSRR